MFVCPFCDHEHRKIKGINRKHVEEHLIVTMDGSRRFHVHGPIGNKPLIKEFMKMIAKEAGLTLETD